MIVEDTFDFWKRTDVNKTHLRELLNIYDDSQAVSFLHKDMDVYDLNKYPYTSMSRATLGRKLRYEQRE